jgi:peptidoglycan/LPS O-acetylase OafA/YrhL
MVTGRTIEYQPALDGLRAWAVLFVVLFHAAATSNLPRLAPGGFLGVSVFFTLSGFLVTTLLIRRSAAPDFNEIVRFWARRLRRLAPVAFVGVFMAVLAAPYFWPGMQAGDAVAGIVGYTNWNVIAHGEDELLRTIVGPLGPYWSLAIEEQFYLFLTGAVFLAWRTARPIRSLAIVVTVGWLLSLAVQIFTSGPQFRLEFGTVSRGGELLAGSGLALLLHVQPNLITNRARQLGVAGPVIAIGMVALVRTANYDPPWLLHGGYSAVSLASAVLVASLLTPGPLTSFLAIRPAVIIGRLSFSWYVVHWPLILILTADRTGLDRWPLLAVKLIVTCAAAALLHVAIEQPVRRLEVSPRVTLGVWGATGLSLVAASMILL